jgi:rfaE bifunctional protein kinase chain/domain
LSPDVEAMVIDRIKEAYKLGIDCLVISDYAKGMITESVARFSIVTALNHEIPIIVDPKRANWEIYAGATVITPNEREWENRHQGIEDVADFPSILVTLGSEGMKLIEGHHTLYFGSNVSSVFDVTGAGDTVVAVLAHLLSVGCDLPEACRLANIGAGIVVGKRGTATVTMEEIRESDV